MEEEAPIIYGLDFQARSLCAQYGETEMVRFLIGTQSLKSENSIHCVEYDEESVLVSKFVYPHPLGEIWQTNAHPNQADIISTVHKGQNQKMSATIYKMSPVPTNGQSIDTLDSTSHGQLEAIASLESRDEKEVAKVLWQPNDGNKVITVSTDSQITLWDFSNEGKLQNAICSEPLCKTHNQVTAANWSPHHGTNQVAVAMETNLQVVDLRSVNRGSIYNIENAHIEPIRDLDFNPNRQYYMTTCGDDGCVKFWDVRNLSRPVLNRHDHYHWVWQVRYNVFHDQLVLTAGSDARVVLSSAASLSSEPFGKLMSDEKDNDEDDDVRSPLADGVITAYEEHEDSVYSVAWSSADSWTFASLSYGGRLLIHRVPRSLKHSILF
ncbi:EARP-interacting protein homolog isoform X1 [Daphnia carinata]|uniref:EARP-interacting protein homolog isoform X1 n=1 Tax=Daphnia carinata TaxID=120202 RepID=UPI00257D66EB|nr:EARP-interacting protein homolog isoform X1 [Daphnia carinata]